MSNQLPAAHAWMFSPSTHSNGVEFVQKLAGFQRHAGSPLGRESQALRTSCTSC